MPVIKKVVYLVASLMLAIAFALFTDVEGMSTIRYIGAAVTAGGTGVLLAEALK